MILATWYSTPLTSKRRAFNFDIEVPIAELEAARCLLDNNGATLTIAGLTDPEQLLPIADCIYRACGLPKPDPAQLTFDAEPIQ